MYMREFVLISHPYHRDPRKRVIAPPNSAHTTQNSISKMEMDPFFAVTDVRTKAKSVPTSKMNNESSFMAVTSSSSNENLTSLKPTTSSAGSSTITATAAGIDPNDKISLANFEISNLLQQNKITQQNVSTLQAILHENVALKEKTQKLKNLLGRSAKAQSDLKTECQTTKQKLDLANKAIEKLNIRLEQLVNRPSHMDILADFEANFDRALLSLGAGSQSVEDDYYNDGTSNGDELNSKAGGVIQPGGQEPSSEQKDHIFYDEENLHTPGETVSHQDYQTMLVEMNELKNHIQEQESLNSTLFSRTTKLEEEVDSQADQIASLQSKNDNLTLELRMSKNETLRVQHKLREKTLALQEMQMEIDLVTKASVEANARASESMEVVKNIKTDKKHVDELEAKVDALQEWALASAEAKRLTVERATELEKKLQEYHELLQEDGVGSGLGGPEGGNTLGVRGGGDSSCEGRRLWTKASSKVVGAGMDVTFIIPLGDCVIAKNEMVVLRWKFDIIPGELDIDFSILKGKYDDTKKRDGADYLIKQRTVRGGAGGEVSGAFAVQNACTLVWSNKRSWIRPRAVKFSVEASAINI